MKETRSTLRFINPTERAIRGIIKAKRGSILTTGTSITLPSFIRYIRLRNTHSSSVILINFNDDSTTDYWTIKPNEIIELELHPNTTINVKATPSIATFEAILMSKT